MCHPCVYAHTKKQEEEEEEEEEGGNEHISTYPPTLSKQEEEGAEEKVEKQELMGGGGKRERKTLITKPNEEGRRGYTSIHELDLTQHAQQAAVKGEWVSGCSVWVGDRHAPATMDKQEQGKRIKQKEQARKL